MWIFRLSLGANLVYEKPSISRHRLLGWHKLRFGAMLILVTNNLLVASVLLLIRNSEKTDPPRFIMNLSIDFRLLLATFHRKGMENYKFLWGLPIKNRKTESFQLPLSPIIFNIKMHPNKSSFVWYLILTSGPYCICIWNRIVSGSRTKSYLDLGQNSMGARDWLALGCGMSCTYIWDQIVFRYGEKLHLGP